MDTPTCAAPQLRVPAKEATQGQKDFENTDFNTLDRCQHRHADQDSVQQYYCPAPIFICVWAVPCLCSNAHCVPRNTTVRLRATRRQTLVKPCDPHVTIPPQVHHTANATPLIRHGSTQLHFNKKIVSLVRSNAVFTWAPTAQRPHLCSTDPSLVYLEIDVIRKRRHAYVQRQIRTGSSNSDPVCIRQKKRLCALQPVRDYEDPYVVAVLIALAQEQRTLARERHNRVPCAVPDQQGQAAVSSQTQITPNISKFPPDEDTAAQHDASGYIVRLLHVHF